MKIIITKPYLKAFSILFGNLSAGWFGLAFITPGFVDITLPGVLFALTKDIIFGSLCLLATVKIEEVIENEF